MKQGRSTFVRPTVHGPTGTLDRTVTTQGNTYSTPIDAWFGHAEEPTVYRTRIDAITAPLLEMDQDELMLG
ncbi:hypothetical protein [Kitasatospora purpeofusca]|uniref:Uncharacterized protein n=1 Tax=Kitasatospora purpeofusca TaxID=67352 RepID=A0ABZ1U4S1_9ACTN|nr:hypothetical protein [Kitasatospora purpeofusca]